MKKRHLVPVVLFLAVIVFAFGSGWVSLRAASAEGATPVHMVITEEVHHGNEYPLLRPQDVTVKLGKEQTQVTDLIPLQGDHAALQLFLLIDDATRPESLGPQTGEIQQFINSQPETTAIGVGYMRNGTVNIAQNFTNDHAQAAHAIRLPLGDAAAMASPYLSIGDLVKRWPTHEVRREIIVISDGIDRLGGVGPANPYVDTAIEQTLRAGVIIYAIYATGIGHFGHSFYYFNWGQNYLSQIASETGGEAYFLGNETPVSFAPYFQDISRRLEHQFLLSFAAKPKKKGGLESVKVRTEIPHTEIVAGDRVWVPGEGKGE